MAMLASSLKKGKSVTRRFVFHASAIATLKVQATFSCVQHPRHVEVVSAFIWKHAMAASRENNGFQTVATPGIFLRVFLNKYKLHNLIKRKFYILTTTTVSPPPCLPTSCPNR